MSSITFQGADGFPEQIPTREDGTPYPFAMAANNNVMLAETRTELVESLIIGYDQLGVDEASTDERLWLRYQSLVAFGNAFQGALAAAAQEAGDFDMSNESEDVVTALMLPKDQKIDEIARWDHKVPLVLLASNYAPYMSSPLPEGENVIVLDPINETTYLDSLHKAEIIELFHDAEAAA